MYHKRTKKKLFLKYVRNAGAQKVSEQVDGGKELYQASRLSYEVARIAARTTGLLGGLLGLITVVVVPVILIVTILYNSPFALFLPPLEDGETIHQVTSAYVSEFISDVEEFAKEHIGYDEAEIVYYDTDGNVVVTPRHTDIMYVYMVKYGVGDTAIIMNDLSRKRLKSVVDDMCSYTISTRTEERPDEAGKLYEVTVLEVHVVWKDYQDMIEVYDFSEEQTKLIEEMMNCF